MPCPSPRSGAGQAEARGGDGGAAGAPAARPRANALLPSGSARREGLGAGNGSVHLLPPPPDCLVLLHPPHATLDRGRRRGRAPSSLPGCPRRGRDGWACGCTKPPRAVRTLAAVPVSVSGSRWCPGARRAAGRTREGFGAVESFRRGHRLEARCSRRHRHRSRVSRPRRARSHGLHPQGTDDERREQNSMQNWEADATSEAKSQEPGGRTTRAAVPTATRRPPPRAAGRTLPRLPPNARTRPPRRRRVSLLPVSHCLSISGWIRPAPCACPAVLAARGGSRLPVPIPRKEARVEMGFPAGAGSGCHHLFGGHFLSGLSAEAFPATLRPRVRLCTDKTCQRDLSRGSSFRWPLAASGRRPQAAQRCQPAPRGCLSALTPAGLWQAGSAGCQGSCDRSRLLLLNLAAMPVASPVSGSRAGRGLESQPGAPCPSGTEVPAWRHVAAGQGVLQPPGPPEGIWC